MAWIKTHYGREIIAPISKFVCDKEQDVGNLPTNVVFGSQATVLETGNIYCLDSNQTWALKVNMSDFKNSGAMDNGGGENGMD